MDLQHLQERLISLTESDDFIDLTVFWDELRNTRLIGFDTFARFTDDSYCSQTLFRIEKFEIRLLCWRPFQETPIHPHPENGCLMKILEGELSEEKFVSDIKTKSTYKKGDVSFISAPESHVLMSLEADSISLHIYSPSGFYDNLPKGEI